MPGIDAIDTVREFLERGGPVLLAIGVVTFLMWTLMLERLWYFLRVQPREVKRVQEKYGAFIERFPDFESLAEAPLRSVLAAWSGLGYNRRAQALKKAAEIVVSDYGGKLPRAIEKLLARTMYSPFIGGSNVKTPPGPLRNVSMCVPVLS